MTPAGDYLHEMPLLREIDDATAERILTGGPVAGDLEPLAAAMAAYRRVTDRPVPPSPELAAQMAAGVFAGTAEPYRPAGRRRAPAPARGLAGRLAGAGTAAKVTVAAAVGLAGTATAGLAGVLPAPAQQRFETVVETVTPYHFPVRTGPAGETGETGEQVGTDPAEGGGVSEDNRRDGDRRPDQLPTPVPASPGPPADNPAPADPPSPQDGPSVPEPAGDPGPPETPPGEQIRPTAPPGR